MFHQGEYVVPDTYLPDVMGRVSMEREAVVGAHQRPFLSPLRAVRLGKKTRNNTLPYVCHVVNCGEKFLNSQGLDTHLKLHLGVKPFMCNFCGKVCKTESKLKTHLASHANDDVKHVCDICERRFSSRSSLSKHKKMIHKPKPHICPECQCGFEERKYMAIHAKQAHDLEIDSECCNDDFLLTTADCSTDSKGTSSGDGNSKSFLEESVDPLAIGDGDISTRETALPSISHNQQDSHNIQEKPLEPIVELTVVNRRDASINCEFCTSTFPSVAYLEQHMAVHVHDRTIACQHCSARYDNLEDLANHLKVHGIENEHSNSFAHNEMKCPPIFDKYICALCKEHFVNLGSLKRHQAKGHCSPTPQSGI
ncbi:putative zinc finger protein 66 [Palaemon carinicauda]|uniref:putative zinc finger protein 66 n=1 Tax=Palaemon carinicauda TaxID=392227 RepID=UPI0035B57681